MDLMLSLFGFLLAIGPANWNKVDDRCGKDRQSPIDIVTSGVVYDNDLGEFSFTGYDTEQPNALFDINNNGHAVGVAIAFEENKVPPVIEVKNGGLDGDYALAQFHFHWGQDDKRGSEHHINSKEYAAELHLVHYKKEYDNLTNSLNYGDGLAVLGIHMEVGDAEHSGFTGFTEHLKKITYEGNRTVIPEYAIDRMLPKNTKDYYRYMGSLTTPPCSEAVVWTVFKDSITISHAQMAEFRTVRDDTEQPIDNNYRPPQPLNGRKVYSSWQIPEPTTAAPPSGQPTTAAPPSGQPTTPAPPSGQSSIHMASALLLACIIALHL